MKHRNTCGMCGSENVWTVLNLGRMPLANAFHEKDEELESYHLMVYFCADCTSLQLLDIVDPEIVFRKYEYLTSASKPLSDHFRMMGIHLVDRYIKDESDLMVEIGGNDGVLLEAVKDKCRVLNIDPAHTACEIAREKGIPTMEIFLNAQDALAVRQIYGPAKVVVANNVMAHIEDFHDALTGVRNLMTPDGVFVFEVHWVGNLIGEGGFDQIYHEHLYYHSLMALRQQIPDIFHVELVPIHGQSLRVYVGNYPMSEDVDQFIEAEKKMGLHKVNTYIKLKDKIEENKEKLLEALKNYKRVVGYGAPAKGNTLLNYYGISLDFIVDTTPGKQGLYTPGTNIPVCPPEALRENVPECILILAWNYANEILLKEQDLLLAGVDFIVPVPDVKVIRGAVQMPIKEGQDAE